MTNREKQLLEIIFELRNDIDSSAGSASAMQMLSKNEEDHKEATIRYDALMEAYEMAELAYKEAKELLK